MYHPGIDISSCIFVLFKWKWWYATLWLPKILPFSSPIEYCWRMWGTRSLHSLTWLPLPGQRGTDVKASRSWGWSFSSSLDHSPAQNGRWLTRGWAEQGCSSRTSRSATLHLDFTQSCDLSDFRPSGVKLISRVWGQATWGKFVSLKPVWVTARLCFKHQNKTTAIKMFELTNPGLLLFSKGS